MQAKKKIKRLSASKLGYLVGLLDGEGSFLINRQRVTDMVGEFYYKSCVLITSTDKKMLIWVAREVGLGSVRKKAKPKKGSKQGHFWICWSLQALAVALLVQPLLKIKAKQASTLIVFQRDTKALHSVSARCLRSKDALNVFYTRK